MIHLLSQTTLALDSFIFTYSKITRYSFIFLLFGVIRFHLALDHDSRLTRTVSLSSRPLCLEHWFLSLHRVTAEFTFGSLHYVITSDA